MPDVPITSFELNLPEGPDSALAANGNLCAKKLVMPTVFAGHNGADHRAKHTGHGYRLRQEKTKKHTSQGATTTRPKEGNEMCVRLGRGASTRLGPSGSWISSVHAFSPRWSMSPPSAGPANVSVAHVSRAGVSRRTFYEVFADREDCFLGAFDEGIARASRYVLDGYDAGARWIQRLRSGLVGLLAFLDAERGMGQLLLVGSLGAGARTLERRQRVLSQTAVVDEGRAPLGRWSDLPPLTAEGIVGGVLQCCMRDCWTSGRSAPSWSWPAP